LTSRSRWSVRSASSTVPSRCSTARRAWSPSRRPSGARPTSTRFPASASSTRWTSWARLLLHRRHHHLPPQGQAAGHAAADRLRERLHRCRRPGRDARARVAWRDRVDGREVRGRGDPGRPPGPRPSSTAASCSRRWPRPTTTCWRSYLEGDELTVAEIKAGIRKLTISGELSRSCAAPRSRTRASSPCSTPSSTSCRRRSTSRPIQGHDVRRTKRSIERTRTPLTTPFSALAFKIAAHPFFGKLTFVRVYSGKVVQGAQVLNSTKGKKERIGKIFQMHANKENPVDEATAGHIYAPSSA
jgi:hypothetical protein